MVTQKADLKSILIPGENDIGSNASYACLCILYAYVDSFEESEEKWLSSLESSRWMEYVRYY